MVGVLVALVVWTVVIGLPADPFLAFAWLWLVHAAWYVGAGWRRHVQFLRDWWPAFAVLVVYLYSRGLSDELIGMPVHWTMPIRVDEWLTANHGLPTALLQDRLCGPDCVRGVPPRWYDVVFTTVYFSHFVVGFVVAIVLYLRDDRVEWVRWMLRYLTINVAGLVVYVLYPMAPPWMASRDGYVAEHLPRLTGRGWEVLGLDNVHTALARVGNPVAAMPSLHGGIAMLVALYVMSRWRSPWRAVVLLYPVLMGVALVYYAEHYVVDILAGWALAITVTVAVGWWERRRGAPATTLSAALRRADEAGPVARS